MWHIVTKTPAGLGVFMKQELKRGNLRSRVIEENKTKIEARAATP